MLRVMFDMFFRKLITFAHDLEYDRFEEYFIIEAVGTVNVD